MLRSDENRERIAYTCIMYNVYVYNHIFFKYIHIIYIYMCVYIYYIYFYIAHFTSVLIFISSFFLFFSRRRDADGRRGKW